MVKIVKRQDRKSLVRSIRFSPNQQKIMNQKKLTPSIIFNMGFTKIKFNKERDLMNVENPATSLDLKPSTQKEMIKDIKKFKFKENKK